MKTIVVSNRKGGSAKTTTAVNLAALLALEYDVLLIDLDTQGHASIGVGKHPVEESGAHSVFSGKTLSESFLPTVLNRLTLSPALEFFDVFEQSDILGVLKQRFEEESIGDFFDYCIIDTAPTYDALLKNALDVADSVIVPVVPHHLGFVGVSQMMRAVFQVGAVGQKVADVGILPVMYNAHVREHRQIVEKLQRTFGKEKLYDPIGIDVHLASSFEMSRPAVLSTKHSRGQKDYQRLLQSVLQRVVS
jgi:chromosome partitioning protein